MKFRADAGRPVTLEMQQAEPRVRRGHRLFRGAAVPGPADGAVATLDRLDRERLAGSSRWLLGDDDLGPMVSIQVGDRELRTLHEAYS